MPEKSKNLLNFDGMFMIGVLALVGIGIVIIYSSSGAYAETRNLPNTFYLVNHIKKVVLALIIFMIGMLVDYKIWDKISRPLIFVVIGLLIYLITSSKISGIHGSKRWVNIFGIVLQPSELAKIAIVFFLARFLTIKEDVMCRFKEGLLSSLVMVGIIFLLVLMQPNYSTAAILLCISLAMVFAGGARLSHLLALGAVGIPLLLLIMFSRSYRMARVTAFLNPDENMASSYQSTQALISLGNGGIFGTGLGTSTQKLGYLPMPFTDSIFSILGEELGLLGTLICLMLFAVIFWRGLRIAYKCQDRFGSLMAVGIVTTISINVIMHVGVCAGLLPTTGQPLPFLSYGGTALITFMFFSGVMLNISGSGKEDAKRKQQSKRKMVHGALAKQRMRFEH